MLAPNFPLQDNCILSDNQSGLRRRARRRPYLRQQKFKPSPSNSWPL